VTVLRAGLAETRFEPILYRKMAMAVILEARSEYGVNENNGD